MEDSLWVPFVPIRYMLSAPAIKGSVPLIGLMSQIETQCNEETYPYMLRDRELNGKFTRYRWCRSCAQLDVVHVVQNNVTDD